MEKWEQYAAARQKLWERTEGERDLIANLANASAILNEYMTEINWVGFYLYREEQLILGPFQGRAACVRIQPGKGVCGTAFAEDRAQLVPDVHAFPGHIACDERSRSEIVLPIHAQGRCVGLLDIDSPILGRFTQEDQTALEEIVRRLEATCHWC